MGASFAPLVCTHTKSTLLGCFTSLAQLHHYNTANNSSLLPIHTHNVNGLNDTPLSCVVYVYDFLSAYHT